MVLNFIFVGFFLTAFVFAFVQWTFYGNHEIFPAMLDATFSMSKTAFEIALGLTGGMCLWLGIMKVGERAGAVNILARLVRPLFRRLFPDLPPDHPAHGSMLMNISANMLGLDNAATPLGLKAMQELQSVNASKETASNSQIMFLVLNTSGLTLIPISVMIYRAQMGAANPADVFLPILLATAISTLVGLIAVSLFQRIKLYNPVVIAWLLGIIGVLGTSLWFLTQLPQDTISVISRTWSAFIIFSVISGFIGLGLARKINVYDAFIDGAKDGFSVATRIIPYLVAILVAIAVFRAAGVMDLLLDGLRYAVAFTGLPNQWIDAMPTALMKPLSGSGARAMMVDAMDTHGADSFIGQLVSTLQGSTDTTFYVLAVYFGSVGIKNTRHAVTCGLLADAAGIIAAIIIAYMFFG
ncbi:nucleoside recognition domain-containing protein [Sulfuriroseicoccus oceanibius]|uniref:Spore maturation protein n=1 Tax=Sulfuriroseicoccus oceanibius TaxID=2707525 RepID=A0A6B3LEB1_9BACT|nr:spore maturation protein [Sulfuriroseicoccus oceanibius]QQL44450.1 spore maturation protein [Sulfuriroseicoccus oceanibius]